MSSDRQSLQTLVRGANALDLLLTHDSFTLAEANRALGLGTSITNRLLKTWQQTGYLQFDPASKRYFAGLTLMRLAAKARAGMGLPEVDERLAELARRIDQTCSCSVLAGRYALYIGRVLGNRALTYHVELGKTLPAEATSTGNVLLAYEPQERIHALFPVKELSRYTEHSPRTVDELMARLKVVRESGFAVNEGQLSQAISAVAVPVRNEAGRVVAAFSIAGPSSEMTQRAIHTRYLPALLEAAADPLTLQSFGPG